MKLGKVFEVSTARLGAHEKEPPVFAISKYDGVVLGSDYHEHRVASKNLAAYKLVEPDDWAYSTIHIDEGSIARNTHCVAGVVSPMYTILKWKGSRHHARYFELLLRSPSMLEVYGDVAQGSINRRRSLPWKTFANIEVEVPCLDEQRRIVDLIGALDDAIEAADEQAAVTDHLLNAHLDSFSYAATVELGDLAIMRSGPSWKASDESSAPMDEALPVLGITNTPSGRELDLESRKYIAGLADKTMRATLSSVIMIRTNGNRNRIGNVYRANEEIVGYAVSAFQILIEPTSPADADWIYWSLSAPKIQRAISESASGSTGLGNVAIGRLKTLGIPIFPETERKRLLDTAESLYDAARVAGHSASCLRTLRSELLTSLLSGAHEVPESYDEVLTAR